MNFDYSKTTLAQGRDNQQRIQEAPNTFGKTNFDDYTQTSNLDKPKQRMAGRTGQRALDYLTDPEERNVQTSGWKHSDYPMKGQPLIWLK